MKADRNDAPEYIRTSSRRSGANTWIIPGIIGTCITLGLLHVAGSAFLGGTAQRLAEKNAQSKPVPIAEITQPEPEANKDWQRIVYEQARSDQKAQLYTTPHQTETTSASAKQTVFNDNNYIPRGADNVVSFIEPLRTVKEQKPAEKLKVIGIEQKPRMKDSACWYREGSIEHRNCRSSVGLNYRD